MTEPVRNPQPTDDGLGMSSCPTCCGPCRLTTNGAPMSREDVTDDLLLAQERWHKARRDGKYFRAERWAKTRDLALDHLVPVSVVNTGEKP